MWLLINKVSKSPTDNLLRNYNIIMNRGYQFKNKNNNLLHNIQEVRLLNTPPQIRGYSITVMQPTSHWFKAVVKNNN